MEKHNDSCEYDREKEIREFEATKAGVKGLVDSGITKVPGFFISPPETLIQMTPSDNNGGREVVDQIPLIDFQGIEKGGIRRSQVIEQIRKASETWGFFNMVNHGVPQTVIDGLLESTRRAHEQPTEAKMDLYSSDVNRPVRFYTISGHFGKSEVASWRNVLATTYLDDEMLNPDDVPSICRKEITEYMKHLFKVRDVLSEVLSEALGLNPNFLGEMECMKSEFLTCLYYPTCPEPEKTFGTVPHSDRTTMTIVIGDGSAGLQILHQGNWHDVPSVQGALTVNIGDFLQLMTNDKFKSVEHRVLAPRSGSRVSATCFFYPGSKPRKYGPIQELLSETNPPIYGEMSYTDFFTHSMKLLRAEQGKILSDFQIIKNNR